MRTVLRSLGTVVLAGSGHNGNQVAIAMDHRIKGGSGVDGPSAQLFGTTVAADPSKQLQSVTLATTVSRCMPCRSVETDARTGTGSLDPTKKSGASS